MDKDISDKLPVEITSVQVQKNNRERYSLYSGDEFIIGISEETLIELDIGKGVTLTPRLFQKIRRSEGRNRIKSYCLKLLSRRDHARKELFEKAMKKGFEAEPVNAVLDHLEQKEYIDDRAFAFKFATDKKRLNDWGPEKIKSHLYQKGIRRSTVDESVEHAFRDEEYEELFLELVARKRRKFAREEDYIRRKKKIFDYLKRKGYRSEHIFNCLDELAESVES